METLYDLKVAFLARLRRQREETQGDLDFMTEGRMTLRRNGVDITEEHKDRIRQTIADYDALIARVEGELNA